MLLLVGPDLNEVQRVLLAPSLAAEWRGDVSNEMSRRRNISSRVSGRADKVKGKDCHTSTAPYAARAHRSSPFRGPSARRSLDH